MVTTSPLQGKAEWDRRQTLSPDALVSEGLRRAKLESRDVMSNSAYHRQGKCWWRIEAFDRDGRSLGPIYLYSTRGDYMVQATIYVPVATHHVVLSVGSPHRGKPHDAITELHVLEEQPS